MSALPSAKAARMASEFGAGETSTSIPNFANVPFASAATTSSGLPGWLVTRTFCGLGAEFLARLARRFEVRRIVRTKTAALEAEIAIGRFGRRNRTRRLGDGNRMLFVANVNDPVWQINLVAVGVGGFAIRNDEAALENTAINRMKGNAHAGVLRRRFEAPNFSLMRGIGEVENDEAIAAERPIAAIAAVF